MKSSIRGSSESRSEAWQRPIGSTPLGSLMALAEQVHAPAIRDDADALARRVRDGLFYVVSLGQFKRGKSTLINTLVHDAVLPTGVAPVTSVVTVIRYGPVATARVKTPHGAWEQVEIGALRDYVTEERNPGNEKGILGVEIFEPTTLLEKGLCLVDTPGIGSVFARNTAATRDFLPQVDAALIVLGADPPITADELDVVEEVSREVPTLLFVIAKSDRTSDVERREAFDFTKRVLSDRLHLEPRQIFEISAMEVASSSRPTRDWTRLSAALERLAADAGADLLAGAQRRGTALLARRLVDVIAEQISLLERPLAGAEQRLASLRQAAATAERALGDLAPLFAAEEARLVAALEREHDEFFHAATPEAEKELAESLASLHERGPSLREHATSEALAVARRYLGAWQAEKTVALDRLYRAGMERFVELLSTVETALRDCDSAIVAGVGPEPALRSSTRFYLTELLETAWASPLQRVLDVLGLGFDRRNTAIRRRAVTYLERLLEVNAARIKNDLRERVSISRRELQDGVRVRLHGTVASTEELIARARVIQALGSASVEAELRRLRDLRAAAQTLMNDADAPTGARSAAS